MTIPYWLTQSHQWLDLVGAIACLATTAWLVRIVRRQLRDLRKARFDLAVSIKAGELLGDERDGLIKLLTTLERQNYHLSCQVYGKAATDRAVLEAGKRGGN